jgi:hypothetical protein
MRSGSLRAAHSGQILASLTAGTRVPGFTGPRQAAGRAAQTSVNKRTKVRTSSG